MRGIMSPLHHTLYNVVLNKHRETVPFAYLTNFVSKIVIIIIIINYYYTGSLKSVM